MNRDLGLRRSIPSPDDRPSDRGASRGKWQLLEGSGAPCCGICAKSSQTFGLVLRCCFVYRLAQRARRRSAPINNEGLTRQKRLIMIPTPGTRGRSAKCPRFCLDRRNTASSTMCRRMRFVGRVIFSSRVSGFSASHAICQQAPARMNIATFNKTA
jgi:hypothetical protein